jgi:hypothetical protein
MDSATQQALYKEFEQYVDKFGLRLDPSATVELRDVFARSAPVSPGDLVRALGSTSVLSAKAVAEHRIRGLAAEVITAEDIRAAMDKICPLWPFC